MAMWASFEAFLQAVLAELYRARPDLLSSERQFAASEVVLARDNIVDYLISNEIADIGRRSFSDMQSYLRRRVQYQFSSSDAQELVDLYFIRNVVSHSAGFIREDQVSSVPDGVDIVGRELRVSQKYLEEKIATIDRAASAFLIGLRNKYQLVESASGQLVAG
jgi:hypothetical protein